MTRPVVGIVGTAAALDRYLAPRDAARLGEVADVRRLELAGADREPAIPDDAATLARLLAFVPDLDALVVTYGAPRITDRVLAAAPRLRLVGDTHGDRFAARIDVEAAARRGVVAVDTTNGSSDPVAEWALALMLVGLRNAGSHFRRLIAGEVLWEDRAPLLTDPGYLHGELTGKTVGLIALGNAGRRLVRLLEPFGVDVVAADPAATAAIADALDVELAPLDVVLSRADVVVCLVPLTTATRGMLGARELALLRPGSVFVNVSRGAVVDTAALVDRLRAGDVIACLDVVEPEPLPADSPLRAMPNVFLSPHIAGVTAEAEPRFFAYMVDEILRVLAGELPRFPLLPRERPDAGTV
jgi:phosphoglycerate dehydrogenase-like enzyme